MNLKYVKCPLDLNTFEWPEKSTEKNKNPKTPTNVPKTTTRLVLLSNLSTQWCPVKYRIPCTEVLEQKSSTITWQGDKPNHF